MTLRWSVYSGAVDDVRDEETLNDCFADLIDDSLARGPGYLNYLLDGVVTFGAEAEIEGTDREPLPYTDEGTDRAIDITIGDESKIVGFESKRGDTLSEDQLRAELAKLEYNAERRDVILVAVTEDWQQPELISTLPEQVRWNSWFHISQRAFSAEGLDGMWKPTISRAQKMFYEFGYRELDSTEAEELSTRIEEEKKRWDDRFVTGFRPPSWGNEWKAKGQAGHIFKEGWRLDANLEPTTLKAPVALQFVHHLRNEDMVSQGLLKFQFRWDGGGDKNYRDRFAAWFKEELEESNLDLEGRDIKQSSRANVFTEKIYEFDTDEFPISYYETLKEAFEEHQVLVDFMDEREEVRTIITEGENE